MRRAVTVSAMLIAAVTAASAGDRRGTHWAENEFVSSPEVPLRVLGGRKTDDGELGSARHYFENVESQRQRCYTRDGRQRAITITCSQPSNGRPVVYKGRFVGAGVLLIETVSVEGRTLNDAERVAYMQVLSR